MTRPASLGQDAAVIGGDASAAAARAVMRRGVVAAFAFGIAVVLAGCAATPAASDLVGAWHDADRLTVLRLASAGTCTADGLIFNDDIVTGTCRWRIAHRDHPPLELDFSADPKAVLRAATYLIDGSGTDATLYEVTDADTGTRYVLQR